MDMWRALTAREEGGKEKWDTSGSGAWRVNGKRLNGGTRRYAH